MIQRLLVGLVVAVLVGGPNTSLATDLSMMPIYRSKAVAASQRVVITADPAPRIAPKCLGDDRSRPECLPLDADAHPSAAGLTDRMLYREGQSLAVATPAGAEGR